MSIRDKDNQPPTPDAIRATKLAEETSHHLDDNRYEIGIPWKMNYSRFTSNFEEAKWTEVPVEDRLQGVEIGHGKNLPTQKTLGVTWNAETDTFNFEGKLPRNSHLQRFKLQRISIRPSSIFSSFTMQARLLVQDIWAAGVVWDDVLPAKLETKWNDWLSELTEIPTICFQRCLRLSHPAVIQLHVFLDAFSAEYAAAA